MLSTYHGPGWLSRWCRIGACRLGGDFGGEAVGDVQEGATRWRSGQARTGTFEHLDRDRAAGGGAQQTEHDLQGAALEVVPAAHPDSPAASSVPRSASPCQSLQVTMLGTGDDGGRPRIVAREPQHVFHIRGVEHYR